MSRSYFEEDLSDISVTSNKGSTSLKEITSTCEDCKTDSICSEDKEKDMLRNVSRLITATASSVAHTIAPICPPIIRPVSRPLMTDANTSGDKVCCSGHGTNGDLSDILANNKAWVEQKKLKDPDFFDRLGAGQNPKYLWIGCSDSRVPANQIMGLQPGEVFVHRNVANLVVPSDLNILTVINYAVNNLGVEHIIVCGHYDCGGVKAALQNLDNGIIEHWLTNIRDVYRLYSDELNAIEDRKLRQYRLVELNTIEQCLNIFKLGIVQKRRLSTYKDPDVPFSQPRIHAVVFSPSEGILKKLPVNFKDYLKQYRNIYDLYDVSVTASTPSSDDNIQH